MFAVMVFIQLGLELVLILTLTAVNTGVNESLPRVPYTKALDIWCFACLFLLCAALVVCIIVSYLQSTQQVNSKLTMPLKPKRKPYSRAVKRTLVKGKPADKALPRKSLNKIKRYTMLLTLFSRVIFPGSFLLFSVSFWFYYLTFKWGPIRRWEAKHPACLFFLNEQCSLLPQTFQHCWSCWNRPSLMKPLSMLSLSVFPESRKCKCEMKFFSRKLAGTLLPHASVCGLAWLSFLHVGDEDCVKKKYKTCKCLHVNIWWVRDGRANRKTFLIAALESFYIVILQKFCWLTGQNVGLNYFGSFLDMKIKKK